MFSKHFDEKLSYIFKIITNKNQKNTVKILIIFKNYRLAAWLTSYCNDNEIF